jgi:hypothetical protein
VNRRRTGRVVDEDGRFVAGAFVTVVSGTTPVPELALVTEDDGTFSIGLPQGRFRLRANTADARSGEAEIDETAETGEGELVIRVG